MPKLLRNLQITDVSSVDVGAGRRVKVLLMKRHADTSKREFSQSERDSAAESGAAMSDGSFPIKSEQDLKNAIKAVGRAKDPEKARNHIKSRAKTLGHEDLIPEGWQKRDTVSAVDALSKMLDDMREGLIAKAATDYDTAAENLETGEQTQALMCELREALCALETSVCSILWDEDLADKAGAITESFDQFKEHISSFSFSDADPDDDDAEYGDLKKELNEYLKYNENHDEKGQFASGDSAGGASGGGSGGVDHHLGALEGAGLERDDFEAAYSALESDKSLSVSDLKQIASSYSSQGEGAQDIRRYYGGNTREAQLKVIRNLFNVQEGPEMQARRVKRLELAKALQEYQSQFETVEKSMSGAKLPEAMQKIVDEAIAKAVADLRAKTASEAATLRAEIAKRDDALVIAKMSEAHKSFHDKLSGDEQKKFAAMSPEDRDAAMEKTKKRYEEDPIYKSMREDNEKLRKRIEAIEDERGLEISTIEAKELGMLQKNAGEIVLKMKKSCDEDTYKAWKDSMLTMKKQRDAFAKQSHAFEELGTSLGNNGGGSAIDELNLKRDELRKSQPSLTEAQAFEKVLLDPANRELMMREKQERMSKIYRVA